MQRKTVWKEVPEVGDMVRAYVTEPLQTITEVRPYTGKYPQWFTHFITITSPITPSGRVKGVWPLGGACWVYLDEWEN